MQCVIVFADGPDVVGHELLVGIGRLLVGVVELVIDLFLLRAVGFQAGVPAADADLRALLHAVLLHPVEVLGPFFLRVAGVAPPHEGEHHARADQPVGEVVHEVVFDLHLGRAVPALAVDQPEHVPHAVDEQVGRFEAVVSVTDDAAARHVVGVIGFDAVSVGHLARQVAVVERNLRERPDRSLALVVRTVAVVEVPRTVVQFRPQGAVLRVVQVVGDGRFAQSDRLALFVRELFRVEQFPGFRVVHVQFAANELIVHLGHRRIEGALRQAVQRKDQPLDLVVHLTGVLILEPTGNKAGISFPFELGDLLAKTEHAFGQRVAELPFEIGNGFGH